MPVSSKCSAGIVENETAQPYSGLFPLVELYFAGANIIELPTHTASQNAPADREDHAGFLRLHKLMENHRAKRYG
jgi:hypothetical protein